MSDDELIENLLSPGAVEHWRWAKGRRGRFGDEGCICPLCQSIPRILAVFRRHTAPTDDDREALIAAVTAERDALAAVVERVREARGNHPECDQHDEGDPVSCGWKRTVQDVDAALRDAPAVSLAEHDAQVLEAWATELRERYPEDVFTKPSTEDYAELHAALTRVGLTLDRFSADLMRRSAEQATAEVAGDGEVLAGVVQCQKCWAELGVCTPGTLEHHEDGSHTWHMRVLIDLANTPFETPDGGLFDGPPITITINAVPLAEHDARVLERFADTLGGDNSDRDDDLEDDYLRGYRYGREHAQERAIAEAARLRGGAHS